MQKYIKQLGQETEEVILYFHADRLTESRGLSKPLTVQDISEKFGEIDDDRSEDERLAYLLGQFDVLTALQRHVKGSKRKPVKA